MNKQIAILAASLAALTVSPSVWAAACTDSSCITEWDTTGAAGTETTLAATGVNANVSAAPLSRGAGLSGNAAANYFGSTGWTGASTDYFAFGFTVNSGYAANLGSLYIATRVSATAPGELGLYYSGNNYSSALYTFNQAAVGTNYIDSVVDLSSLQGLTGTVTFEIRQIGNTADNGGSVSSAGTVRIGDYENSSNVFSAMRLDGTVSQQVGVVPLPDSAFLFLAGVGALAFAATRRRSNATDGFAI